MINPSSLFLALQKEYDDKMKLISMAHNELQDVEDELLKETMAVAQQQQIFVSGKIIIPLLKYICFYDHSKKPSKFRTGDEYCLKYCLTFSYYMVVIILIMITKEIWVLFIFQCYPANFRDLVRILRSLLLSGKRIPNFSMGV